MDTMFRNNILKNTLLYGLIALLPLLFSNNLLAHRWMAPKEAAQKQNPIPLNQVTGSSGKEIYTQNCAYCHGNNARGFSSEGTGLRKDTPNLIQALKNHTDGDLHWKIQNGKDAMPSFQEDLSENDIWNVINYIKSLKK
jgi:mono/diheme cytochrome c family protein